MHFPCMRDDIDERLRRLAERQYGVFSLDQAKAQFALQAAQNSTSIPTITAPATTETTGSQTTTTG